MSGAQDFDSMAALDLRIGVLFFNLVTGPLHDGQAGNTYENKKFRIEVAVFFLEDRVFS